MPSRDRVVLMQLSTSSSISSFDISGECDIILFMNENNLYELNYSFPPIPFFEKSLNIDVGLNVFVDISISPEGFGGGEEQKSRIYSSLLMLIHQKLMGVANGGGINTYTEFEPKATKECSMAVQEKGNESGFKVDSIKVRVELPEEDHAMIEKIALEQEKIKNASSIFAQMAQDAQLRPKFCTNCGAPVSVGKFCTNCGSPL